MYCTCQLNMVKAFCIGPTGIKWVDWDQVGSVDRWKTVDPQVINQHSLCQGGKFEWF